MRLIIKNAYRKKNMGELSEMQINMNTPAHTLNTRCTGFQSNSKTHKSRGTVVESHCIAANQLIRAMGIVEGV